MKRLLIILLCLLGISLYATTYYVAPTGGSNGNNGTIGAPWATLAYAINQLSPGDTLFIRGGVFYITSTLRFDSVLDGISGNPIVMINYPGENPIVDCANIHAANGIVMNGVNYWTVQGIEQRYAHQDGTTTCMTGFSCNNSTNIHLNYIKVHDNGGYGMDIRMCDEIYVRGVDTYNNCDSLNSNPAYNGGKGDGNGGMNYTTGADTLTWGAVYFDKCRSWNNSDDGWGVGYQMYCYIDSCWAWKNGSPLYAQGAGRGFSTGHAFYPQPVLPIVILTNCVSVYNKGAGYFHNCNGENYTTTQAWYNCISAFNGSYGFSGSTGPNPPTRHSYWKNNIAYHNGNIPFRHEGTTTAPAYIIRDHNTWDSPVIVTDADFVSVDSTGITAARQADGSFPDNDCYNNFMCLSPASDLIDAGVDVGLPYKGKAPDLGAYESESKELVKSVYSNDKIVVSNNKIIIK